MLALKLRDTKAAVFLSSMKSKVYHKEKAWYQAMCGERGLPSILIPKEDLLGLGYALFAFFLTPMPMEHNLLSQHLKFFGTQQTESF